MIALQQEIKLYTQTLSSMVICLKSIGNLLVLELNQCTLGSLSIVAPRKRRKIIKKGISFSSMRSMFGLMIIIPTYLEPYLLQDPNT